MTASRAQVDLLVGMLDHTLDQTSDRYAHWHSVIWNLQSVDPREWTMLPPGGRRTIREMVGHLGECYLKYQSHAFGNGSHLRVEGNGAVLIPGETAEEATTWLRACHATFRKSVAELTDEKLHKPRKLPWDEMIETVRIVEIVIQHALYHAGEINHVRAVLQGNDDW